MQKYRKNAGTDVRVEYGDGTLAGLGSFPETAAMRTTLETVNEDLFGEGEKKRRAGRERSKAYVLLKVSEYKFEATVRAFGKAVEIADGNRNGPLMKAIFPEGLPAVLAPSGTRQVEPAGKWLDAVKACRLPKAEPLKTEWLPRLTESITTLSTACTAYGTARKNLSAIEIEEKALRDEHEMAVDKLMGLVRATFPNDRAKQDAIFPDVGRKSKGKAADADTDEDEDDSDTTEEESK